jgi:hypothetical protein
MRPEPSPQSFEPLVSLSRALTEPSLFGKTFSASSFWTWRVVAKLIDGLPLTEPREVELFEQCTGRIYNREARRAVRRFVILVGRRGGKDRFLSAVAVWRAALAADWRKYQSAGEGAVVILLGRDKKQASILRRYCRGLLQVPALAAEVVRDTSDVIEFRNGSSLEISSNDAALVRGRSAIAVLGSEAMHWKHDEHSSSSDEEVVAGAVPSMAMCPDAGLLLLGSSVYRKRGYCYRKFRELHGNNEAEDVCWFAPSSVMNPKLPQAAIDKGMADDPQKAGAEFLNVWREDLSDFIPLDAIEGCTDVNICVRFPQPGIVYRAFCDAAGGTGSDSFTLCIAHRLYDQAGTVIIDALYERKPRFVPREVIAEYAQILKSYNVTEIQGDKYAGGFHADEWQRNGIQFTPCERTTSENYLYSLPMLLAGRVRLIDSATLRTQLASLERRISPAGHETVSHPQVASAHDDCATAVCGALSMSGLPGYDASYVGFRSGASTPTQQTTADDRLRELYRHINLGFRYGLIGGW